MVLKGFRIRAIVAHCAPDLIPTLAAETGGAHGGVAALECARKKNDNAREARGGNELWRWNANP